MTNNRPPLTLGAKSALDEYNLRIRNTIHNLAEKRVLRDRRFEITENDVIEAQLNISINEPSRRKWGIRILILLTFTLISVQIAAFFKMFQVVEFQILTITLQIWLIVPVIGILMMMIIFTWIFKSDWL